jgi:hypothetical protein
MMRHPAWFSRESMICLRVSHSEFLGEDGGMNRT